MCVCIYIYIYIYTHTVYIPSSLPCLLHYSFFLFPCLTQSNIDPSSAHFCSLNKYLHFYIWIIFLLAPYPSIFCHFYLMKCLGIFFFMNHSCSFFKTLTRITFVVAAAAAKSLQLCPTLCNPIDGSPPGFPVPGILQSRTLEWVAISFSNAWK